MADSSGQTADFTEEAEAHPSGPNDCETAIVCSSKCATSKTNVRVVAQDNGFIPPLSEKEDAPQSLPLSQSTDIRPSETDGVEPKDSSQNPLDTGSRNSQKYSVRNPSPTPGSRHIHERRPDIPPSLNVVDNENKCGVGSAVPASPTNVIDFQYLRTNRDGAKDFIENVGSRPSHGRRASWRLSYDFSHGRLVRQLSKAMLPTQPFAHLKFLPASQLPRLFNITAVEIELSKSEASLRRLFERLQMWKSRPHVDVQKEARKVCGIVQESSSTAATEQSEKSEDTHLRGPRAIPRTFQKIFAILLLIERPSRIRLFLEEGICDADLPILRLKKHDRSWNVSKPRYTTVNKVPVKCFKGWSPSTVARFQQKQWAMLTRSFKWSKNRPVEHLKLSPDEVLPFTHWKHLADGGFGQVYQVEIHPDHHNFPSSGASKQLYAIKELTSKQEDMFTRETEILKRLSRAPHTHPHLITLLAIYEQLGRCNLIFPHAECNLLQYWKVQEPTPDQDGRTALWLAEQCQGLAEGLGRIHRYETVSVTGLLNPNSIPVTEIHSIESIAKDSHNSTAPQDPQRLFGRHGDIKPENILWFADHSAAGGRGILKITDFGISQFSLRTSKPASDCAPIANSPTYRPPECDLNGTISASYDIWTLGCVYLEFVTWFFGGRDYVNRFGESRLVVDPYHHSYKTDTFFSIQHDHSGTRKAKVKDKVNDWIKRLHLKAADIPFFQDFLKMISSSLLIIDGRSTTDSAEGRKSSASIARELSGMVQKCKKVVYYIPPHLGPSTTDASVGSFHSPASSRASSIVQEEIIMNNPIEEMGT